MSVTQSHCEERSNRIPLLNSIAQVIARNEAIPFRCSIPFLKSLRGTKQSHSVAQCRCTSHCEERSNPIPLLISISQVIARNEAIPFHCSFPLLKSLRGTKQSHSVAQCRCTSHCEERSQFHSIAQFRCSSHCEERSNPIPLHNVSPHFNQLPMNFYNSFV